MWHRMTRHNYRGEDRRCHPPLQSSPSGYDVSQRVRKRIEEIFGWGKDVGPIRKTKFRGKDRVGFQLLLTLAGYNLIRMRNILAEVPT